ncbi:hypothetical protein EX30DRAFT_17576 [Ascodesmis nigricans]|uniref:Uncharacterized protein n=1 Tax=Ascodesmis nigricans TaxID=341454 RepID=A0A4S2N7H1_9PEZI|nr:hypothetical protein EX30DRAFT_17576 [Ascodesmis nigricans]
MSVASSRISPMSPARTPLKSTSPLPAPIPRPALSIDTLLSPVPSNSTIPHGSSPATPMEDVDDIPYGFEERWHDCYDAFNSHSGNLDMLHKPFIPPWTEPVGPENHLDPWANQQPAPPPNDGNQWGPGAGPSMENPPPQQQPMMGSYSQPVGGTANLPYPPQRFQPYTFPEHPQTGPVNYTQNYPSNLPTNLGPMLSPQSGPSMSYDQNYQCSQFGPSNKAPQSWHKVQDPDLYSSMPDRNQSAPAPLHTPPQSSGHESQQPRQYSQWVEAKFQHQRTVLSENHPPSGTQMSFPPKSGSPKGSLPGRPGGIFEKLPKEPLHMIFERLTLTSYTVSIALGIIVYDRTNLRKEIHAVFIFLQETYVRKRLDKADTIHSPSQ